MTGPRSWPDPLSSQLSPPSYLLDLRGAAAPARGPALAALASPAGAAAACVVIVGRAGDAEARAVAAVLAKVGIGCLHIEAGSLESLSLVLDLEAGTLRAGGKLVHPAVTWIRHFSARAIGTAAGDTAAGDTAAGDAAREAFMRDSWAALVSQVSAVSGTVIGADGPGQLAQLATAARLGVAVPRTLVTSDPRLARDVFTTPRVVVKALHSHFTEIEPGLLAGAFPRVVPRGSLDVPRWRPAVPVVVQEFVEHDRELRCYYVGGEIFGFQVTKSAPADPWLDPGRVRVESCEPPETARAAAGAIAAALGLRYGAFDFLIGAGGPVFLEVNTGGDWRWIEDRTGRRSVTMAVARMIAGLHAGPASTAAPAGGPAAGSLDLIRFLA